MSAVKNFGESIINHCAGVESGPLKLRLHVYELDYFISLLETAINTLWYKGMRDDAHQLAAVIEQTRGFYQRHRRRIDDFFGLPIDERAKILTRIWPNKEYKGAQLL